MSQFKTCFWYIDPCGDPVTNKIIGETLPEENECHGKLCSDGKRRDLWVCEHSIVTHLENARKALHLKFNILVQRNQHGKIRFWKFEKKHSRANVADLKVNGHHD
jgi:hypothetical protein